MTMTVSTKPDDYNKYRHMYRISPRIALKRWGTKYAASTPLSKPGRHGNPHDR